MIHVAYQSLRDLPNYLEKLPKLLKQLIGLLLLRSEIFLIDNFKNNKEMD